MWLYVPETSSPCAQGSADLNSASSLLSSIGGRLAEASATWRGKPQPPQAWSRRWKQGGFIQRLSGLTCEPSTLDRGVEQFISSLRATPARTTPSPESAPGPMARASLRPKSPALPKSAGLMLSSARTYRGTRTNSSPPSLHHWRGWATALRQEYSARPALATPCDASDCSSWPGPDATNRVRDEETLAKCAAFRLRNAGQKTVPLYLAEVAQAWEPDAEWMAPVADDTGTRTKKYGQGGTALSLQASSWAGPKASDREKAGPNMRGSRGNVPLPGQAAQWIAPMASDDGQKVTSVAHQKMLCNQAQNWPGPRVSAAKGNGLAERGEDSGNCRLGDTAAFFRPPSSPDQPIAGGSMSSTDSPNSNQPSVKRKLNPIFVEALMRWPTGLSGFERQETAWTRWLHVQLSFLSALYSASEVSEEQYDMFGAAA